MKLQPLRVLLTFTGLHDPFANSAIAGTAQDGPILTLLRYRSFERVVLLSTPRTVDVTAETEREIARRYPSTEVSLHHIDLVNPIEYAPILDGLRRVFQVVSDSSDSCRYFVATASGTPQMHASSLLLIASGEVPATCLYVRQPQFVQENSDPVVEIDPSRRISLLCDFVLRQRSSRTPIPQMRLARPNGLALLANIRRF
jgi:sigma54-dependent transcription regulator